MTELDASEFVDRDFQSARQSTATPPHTAAAPVAAPAVMNEPHRAPTREELENRVGEMQHKLAELKRAQAELERERSAIEETKRRQNEFTQGREEMVQHLTRGIGLLEEAEFAARRDAEQMARTLVDLREALVKVQAVQEDTWTRDNLNAELSRAGMVIENARMEWNSARMKFPILSGETPAPPAAPGAGPSEFRPFEQMLQQQSYAELCKLGLALTWPIALAALAIFLVLLMR